MKIIKKYFPDATPEQIQLLASLKLLYETWNARINVISRKDMEHFYERHVLHSLAISRIFPFREGSSVLDLGTGGGFPGIPLAIMYPDCKFTLVDSIRKKISVVTEVSASLKLQNVEALWQRAEDTEGRFDTVVTRAVAGTDQLIRWVSQKSHRLLALKGGDLSLELKAVPKGVKIKQHPLSTIFDEPFFQTKVLVQASW